LYSNPQLRKSPHPAARRLQPPCPPDLPKIPSGGQTTENLTKFGSQTPYGRPGQPAELAATYVLLASPESSYVTGGNPKA